MDPLMRIEQTLSAVLNRAVAEGAPLRLSAGVHHAVFPAGARVRPRLCLAVAAACGEDRPALTDAAAAAVELLHCASLVHDDMPCFDNAATRRGLPSVHRAYGERIALLAGDALIVLAFETVARAAAERAAPILIALSRGVGMPHGIVAGQAWECEPRVNLSDYQRAKTSALFITAAQCGALASGHAPEPWAALGDCLGEAYQVADDIRDVVATTLELGKPQGQDLLLGRPSAAAELGLEGAVERFDELIELAQEAVPMCRNQFMLRGLIRMEAERLLPTHLQNDIAAALAGKAEQAVVAAARAA